MLSIQGCSQNSYNSSDTTWFILLKGSMASKVRSSQTNIVQLIRRGCRDKASPKPQETEKDYIIGNQNTQTVIDEGEMSLISVQKV